MSKKFAFRSPVTYSLGFDEHDKTGEMEYVPIFDSSALLKHVDIFYRGIQLMSVYRRKCVTELSMQHPSSSVNQLAFKLISYFEPCLTFTVLKIDILRMFS